MKDMVVRFLLIGVFGVVIFSFIACNFNKESKFERDGEIFDKGSKADKTNGESISNDAEKTLENQDYLGEWIDLNSETKLEIDKKELTLTIGNDISKYSYRIKIENKIRYLMSKEKNGNFDIMSRIEIKEDGTLLANEEVLDKTPHQFRFVREETRRKDLEIQDLSTEAPKTIESTELNQFELLFYNDGRSYGISENWEIGAYRWVIEKEQDGSYRMDFNISGDSYMILRYSEKVEKGFVEGLAHLIKEQELSLLNGYYKMNKVNRPGYSLFAMYESGESLSIAAGGDAADTCVFDIQPLLDYTSVLDMKPF